MSYPPGWRLAHGDAGTVTAIRYSSAGRILGYLNLTPRQGNEELATWPVFRLNHNRDDNDHSVRGLASDTNLGFPSGRGSCLEDSYATSTDASYREIACLVTGSRATAVIVGAAPPKLWSQMGSVIEQAIAAVRT